MSQIDTEIKALQDLRRRIKSDPDNVLGTLVGHMITLAMAIKIELEAPSTQAKGGK